jgi:hypothetical protein
MISSFSLGNLPFPIKPENNAHLKLEVPFMIMMILVEKFLRYFNDPFFASQPCQMPGLLPGQLLTKHQLPGNRIYRKNVTPPHYAGPSKIENPLKPRKDGIPIYAARAIWTAIISRQQTARLDTLRILLSMSRHGRFVI